MNGEERFLWQLVALQPSENSEREDEVGEVEKDFSADNKKEEAGQVVPPPYVPFRGCPASLTEGG